MKNIGIQNIFLDQIVFLVFSGHLADYVVLLVPAVPPVQPVPVPPGELRQVRSLQRHQGRQRLRVRRLAVPLLPRQEYERVYLPVSCSIVCVVEFAVS